MDDFRPADVGVNFSNGQGLIHFTYRRGDNDLMVAVWIDGPSEDGVRETKTDIVLQGVSAKRATVADIMNGREQELNIEARGADMVLPGMRVKDYPVLITVSR